MVKFTENDRFLVTGASSGIGKSITLLLNSLGASVIAVGRNVKRLEDLKIKSDQPNHSYIEELDLSENLYELKKWTQGIAKKYGKLKGMVLSAGVSKTIPIEYESIEDGEAIFKLNYFSNIELSKGFMSTKVHNEFCSSVVIVSSIASIQGITGKATYGSSKSAINSAVRALAIEGASKNIRFNTVLPGLVRTEMLGKDEATRDDDFLIQNEAQYPLGLGKPDDVAYLTSFLLSDCSRWITGQQIVIDGGRTIV